MSSNSEDYPKEFAKEFANLNFAVRPARLQKIINSQAEEIQKAREILVGMNAGSLSKDYPLAKLAETAAAELTALNAKVKALEDALKPFADRAKSWDFYWGPSDETLMVVKIADLRRAVQEAK